MRLTIKDVKIVHRIIYWLNLKINLQMIHFH